MWPFRPKHTVESVAKELIEGLDNGTVVLPWSEEELDALEEQSVIPFAPPAIAEGPFKRYSLPPTATRPPQRKRRLEEAYP